MSNEQAALDGASRDLGPRAGISPRKMKWKKGRQKGRKGRKEKRKGGREQDKL
jgi:hypothetical protein